MASIKEIALAAGVSTATVSNALTGKGRVSAQVIDRVRAQADALGYRPSNVARALKTGQTGTLGLVMPDLTNPLFPRMAQTLTMAAEQRGLGLLIADSHGDEVEQCEAIRRLVDRSVDGIVVVPQKGTTLEPSSVPMAVINTASDPQNTVCADHAGGGVLIGRHVADIGHRDVVLLGADPVSEVQQDRITGFSRGLMSNIKKQVFWGELGLRQLVPSIRNGATAVLTTSDLLALRVLSELIRAQMDVPRDVSVTGFDDMNFAAIMHPALTTVAQDVSAIAEHALDVLTAKIQGQTGEVLGATIPMRLVTRASTAIPK
ncbi:MAG: LacI family DNA-binding transcriptional regulator [Roseobacter sp.]